MTNTGETTDWTAYDPDTGEIRPVTVAELYELADMIDGYTREAKCDCHRCTQATS